MKKTRHLLIFRIFALVLFLGIGQISLASLHTDLDTKGELPGEIQLDHHLNYEGLTLTHDMIMAEGNYQLPSVNELKPNFNTGFPKLATTIIALWDNAAAFVLQPVRITPSLDGLTMIYPFHTFL